MSTMSQAPSSSPFVVVVGSLHYDIVLDAPHRPAAGETVTGTRWYPKFGGKGGNQAMAARRHGAPVRLVSATGSDGFATYLEQVLDTARVSRRFVTRLEGGHTGMSVAIHDANGDYGAVIVSGTNLQIDASMLEDEGLWQEAGILVLQNEVSESLNLAAARKARSRGLPVCLNAAPYRELPASLLAVLSLLVLNALEAESLCGVRVGSLRQAQAAAESLARPGLSVVVTAGEAGVAACSEAGSISIPAHPVALISTHGAGDVFTGTMASAMVSGMTFEQALHEANLEASRHVAQRAD